MYRIKSKCYVSTNVIIDGSSVSIPPKPESIDLDIKDLTQELKLLQSKSVIQITIV